MNPVRSLGPPLALIAGACIYAPPPPPLTPPPSVRPAAPDYYRLVTGNPDTARILTALDNRGVVLTPSDVSRVDLLAGAPGYSWRIGGRDHLHIHVYPDRLQAASGAQRFVTAVMSRSQIIDWVGPPRLFQCGSAVALFLGDSPQVLQMLTNQCGPPVYDRTRGR